MGDLRRDRLLGPRELLAIAVTEREIYNIRLLFCERHFYRKVILIGKCSIGLLAMCFVSQRTKIGDFGTLVSFDWFVILLTKLKIL